MNKALKTTTALSLLLNVLLVGGIIGHCWHHEGPPEPWRHSGERVAAQLAPEKRAVVDKAMHQLDADNEASREQLDAARKEAARLLKADPFDKTAYLAQMQHIHELHGQLMQHMAKAIADTAEKLTPDERVQLADMFRNPPPPPPGAHPGGPPPGGPDGNPPPAGDNAPPPPHQSDDGSSPSPHP